jgi:drug/metabolite transporter (DMT)-like permease
MNSNKLFFYYCRLLLALLLWSGAIFVVRRLVSYTSIYLVADIRYIISSVILIFLHKIQRGYFVPKLTFKQWLSVFFVSLFGIIVYNLFFLSAIKLIAGSVYAMIFALVPTITTSIAIFLFRINFNRYTIIGILTSFVATVMLISTITPECRQFFCTSLFSNGIGFGEIFAFLATLSFSLFAICNSYAARVGVHPLELNVYSAIFGAIGLVIISCFHVNDFQDVINILYLPREFWVDMFYITVLSTVLAYIWYTQAIVKIGVAATSVLQNTMPLQSVLIGYFFMKDEIATKEIFAGLIVLIGVYVTNFSLNYVKKSAD